MRFRVVYFIIVIVFTFLHGSVLSARVPGDSSAAKTYSPVTTGLLSGVIPGAGQVYTGHYFMGGAIIATEIITGSMAHYWYSRWKENLSEADDAYDALHTARNLIDTLYARENNQLRRFDAKSARFSMYNSLSWMVGAYVFNIGHALKATGVFKNDEYRSPLKAGWLSAIPGFGLGQIYNGELSKAGMVMMTQVSLGVLAVNEHRLMQRAQKRYLEVISSTDPQGETPLKDKYRDEWDSRQKDAFKNRNSYLWYSLAFYFYGILDAVVDAHLHDYTQKMKVYPDLAPQTASVGFTMEYDF